MKLVRLKAFKEVMESGTVTGAAKNLKCGQPRVSRLISELEDEIGFPLFRREKQRLYPSAEGVQFFNETQRLLLGINNIEQVAKDICDKRETTIRILTQSHIAHGLLSRVMGEFNKNVKDIRYNIVVRPRDELTKWLRGAQFDLAFTALPANHRLVRHKKILSIKLMVALPKQHPYTAKSSIDVKDLPTLPIIALSKGLPMRERIDDLFERAGIEPIIRIETPTVFSACQLVSQGLGATLTEPFTASLFSDDDFILRPLSPEYIVDYGVLFLKQIHPRLIVQRFVNVAMRVSEDLNREVVNRV